MYGERHYQYVLLFLCFFIAFLMRLDITVAIVAMTDRRTANPDFPELDWDVKIKTKVLSSFFWGYFIPQLPAGILARRYGPKNVLTFAMITCSMASGFIPFVSLSFGWKLTCFIRFIQGISQGFIHPSVYTHLSKWSPPKERSKIVAYVLCGQQFGSVVTLLTAGFVSASSFGWPCVFYMTGTTGMIWTILWFKYAINSPQQCQSITMEELSYIEESEEGIAANRRKLLKTPWKSILKSKPVWVLVVVHSCNSWGYWTLVTLSPSFLNAMYGMNVKSNGFLSSIPHLSMLILAIIFGSLSELFVKRSLLSVNASRKMWNSIAHWGGAISLLGVALWKDNLYIVLSLLTVALAINSATFTGFLSNHLDLSPNYAGILMGLTNFISNIAAMLAPLFAGHVIPQEKNAEDWTVVFYTSSGIFFISNCIFLLFGSTEVQPWNKIY